MSFFENTRKPVGLGGNLMVAMMNLGHSPVARWGLRFLRLAPNAEVLDCGCGGGANIKRLLKKCPHGVVKGIDYSPVSVEKARKLNRIAIQEGRCAVLQGSVADMVFEDSYFDAATAFPDESATGLTPYDKFFLTSYPGSGGWDTETIYQPTNYGAQRQSLVWQYAGMPIDDGQVSAGACPTQEMVDAYEVLNDDGSESTPLLDLANPYNADGSPNISQKARDFGYVDCSDKMYLNRDPRFYATIYYDGVTVKLENSEYEVETFVGGNCGLSLSPSSRRNTCTGYYLRKFNNAQSSTSGGNKDGYIRMFRLAELYLNFAEAAYRAHGADWQAPATEVLEMEEGDDGETVEKLNTYGTPMSAREAVNAVRARVGMPGVADDGEAFWLSIARGFAERSAR